MRRKPAEATRGQTSPLHMGLLCFRRVSDCFGHGSVSCNKPRVQRPGAHWAWASPPAPASHPFCGHLEEASLQVSQGQAQLWLSQRWQPWGWGEAGWLPGCAIPAGRGTSRSQPRHALGHSWRPRPTSTSCQPCLERAALSSGLEVVLN